MRLPTLRKETCENRIAINGISPQRFLRIRRIRQTLPSPAASLPSQRHGQPAASACIPLNLFPDALPDQTLRSRSPLCPPSIMGTPICEPEGCAWNAPGVTCGASARLDTRE